jgi:hypothetical protein
MNTEEERKHLARADQHIAELKKDITRQWQIIEELSMDRQPLHDAVAMLKFLKDHLRIMEGHRQSILSVRSRTLSQVEIVKSCHFLEI